MISIYFYKKDLFSNVNFAPYYIILEFAKRSKKGFDYADVAQLVEHLFGKQEVMSSSLVVSSMWI